MDPYLDKKSQKWKKWKKDTEKEISAKDPGKNKWKSLKPSESHVDHLPGFFLKKDKYTLEVFPPDKSSKPWSNLWGIYLMDPSGKEVFLQTGKTLNKRMFEKVYKEFDKIKR
jgi:hypothetical protein